MSKKNTKKYTAATTTANTAAQSSNNFTTAIEGLVTKNNSSYSAADVQTLLADMMGGKLVVLTEDQESNGINAELKDTTNPVVTYTDKAGNVLANVDFKKLFVGRKVQNSFKFSASKAGNSAANTGSAKVFGKNTKPQAKSFGKKQAQGKAANTATATVPQSAELKEAAELLDRLERFMAKFGGKKPVEAKEEKAEKPEISEKEQLMIYEDQLLRAIIRLNSRDNIMYGGIKNIRVPTETPDGNRWRVVAQNEHFWTFKNVRKPDVLVDIGIVDVQLTMDHLYD